MIERWIRRALGALQIGGGFVGIYVIVSNVSPTSTFALVIGTLFVALFAFGMVAGVALIEGDRRGRRLSLVNWWLQVPIISSPLIAYDLWSGTLVSIYLRLDGIKFGFNLFWGAGFDFSLLRAAPYLIGINLFAVFALYLLHEFVAETPAEPHTLPELEPQPSLAERVATERQSASELP